MTFCSNHPVNIPSAKALPFNPNIAPRYTNASPIDSARNITQPSTTKRIVYSHLNTFSTLPFFLCIPVNFSMTSNTKYIKPQTIKVKLAPCHNPVRNQTTKRLKIFRPLLQRLPPSGM